MKVITKEYLQTHKMYPMDLGLLLGHVEDVETSAKNIEEFLIETEPDEEKRKDIMDEINEYYCK